MIFIIVVVASYNITDAREDPKKKGKKANKRGKNTANFFFQDLRVEKESFLTSIAYFTATVRNSSG